MKDIINQFYTAFNALDAEAMVSLYHDDITFEDPAFGVLKGERAKNMWRMLCESQQGKDFKVEHSEVTDNSAFWQAHYTFSKTGRKVHNKIHARFEFKDGLIYKHTDYFDLHRWAKQALGFSGAVLGWSGYFKKKLQSQTNRLLDKYEQSKA
ncbi:nuclear transport factor 2 family protein [Roseivirga sp.]|uniref:nuclear transport factor 2 family protein n=1 Tax=Roseivirga sp. TaxID=1964215 RepID=UPI003B515F64